MEKMMSGYRSNGVLMRVFGAAILFAVVLAATFLDVRSVEAEPTAVRHLTLVSTNPSADTVLAEGPEEIRLVFSEAPREGGTTLRLTGAGNALMATTDATRDSDNPTQYFFRPQAPLPAGDYTVHWRTVANDGHTMRGTFGFRVASE